MINGEKRIDTEKKLEELAMYLGDNDIVIIKSAPMKKGEHSNKLAVSIHNGIDKYIDYEFEEDVTTDKILDKEYKELKTK